MVKVEIDVDQVLTSAVALEVEVGDKILVMNGVVIGMVEGRRPPRPVIEVGTPQPPSERATTAPISRYISRGDLQIQEQILDLLRHKEMTAKQLSDRLRADNNGERLVIRELIIGMRGRSLIEPVNHHDRYPAYRLTPQPQP